MGERCRKSVVYAKAVISEKRCHACLETKPIAEFCSNRGRPDGYDYRCRVCLKIRRSMRAAQIAQRLAEQQLSEKGFSASEMPAATKRCSKCQETKPLEQFHRSKTNADGRLGYCAACYRLQTCLRLGRPLPGSQVETFLDPDSKRCSDCRVVKIRQKDFRCSPTSSDGYASRCSECQRQVQRDYYRRNANYICQRNKAYRSLHADRINAQARQKRNGNPAFLARAKKYRQTHKARLNAQARERRARNPEDYRDIRRKYYHRNAARLRAEKREYRKNNPERHHQVTAKWREENRERILHRRRVLYWANPEKARLQKRLYEQRKCSSQQRTGDIRAEGKYRRPNQRTLSLDEVFQGSAGKNTLSRMDRVADSRIASPENAVLEAPSLQAVRAFVSEELTVEERLILETFSDCGFSAAGAAELLDLSLGEVEAAMSAIRSRAAALKED